MTNEIKTLAQNFLNLADSLYLQVSRYLNGSNANEDMSAYLSVKEAEKKFIDALSKHDGEKYECCLNYELAESVLY